MASRKNENTRVKKIHQHTLNFCLVNYGFSCNILCVCVCVTMTRKAKYLANLIKYLQYIVS